MNTKEFDGFSESFSEQPEVKGAPAPKPAAVSAQSERTPEVEVPEKKGSKTAVIWLALILGAALLILLLVFIVQNNVSAAFQYFSWQFNLPLGVAMLLAAIAGALIMALVGSVRIAQLRWQLHKMRRQQEHVARFFNEQK